MQYPKLSGTLAAKRAVVKRATIHLTEVEKFVSSGKRKVRGLASSVRPDRVGDVVEPKGGIWTLPLPMLWSHSHKDPVGWVRSIHVRADGLWIEAEFAEGFDRADEVWRMVEAGLVNNFSIGFRSIESSALPSGGLRFTKWELLEVSCCVVPANPDAKISRSGRAVEPVQLVEANPGAIKIIRPPGSVKLVSRTRCPGGVPLVERKKPIKLKRADGSILLNGDD
ncbi:MAG TPA: HK97 family phage prohead protease [Luteimonas sp.]|nr:HK97 family phage prohead protease [Luteimonas sp.]